MAAKAHSSDATFAILRFFAEKVMSAAERTSLIIGNNLGKPRIEQLAFVYLQVWEHGSFRKFYLRYDPDDEGGITKSAFRLAAGDVCAAIKSRIL
jgi:hypothetical protein